MNTLLALLIPRARTGVTKPSRGVGIASVKRDDERQTSGLASGTSASGRPELSSIRHNCQPSNGPSSPSRNVVVTAPAAASGSAYTEPSKARTGAEVISVAPVSGSKIAFTRCPSQSRWTRIRLPLNAVFRSRSALSPRVPPLSSGDSAAASVEFAGRARPARVS